MTCTHNGIYLIFFSLSSRSFVQSKAFCSPRSLSTIILYWLVLRTGLGSARRRQRQRRTNVIRYSNIYTCLCVPINLYIVDVVQICCQHVVFWRCFCCEWGVGKMLFRCKNRLSMAAYGVEMSRLNRHIPSRNGIRCYALTAHAIFAATPACWFWHISRLLVFFSRFFFLLSIDFSLSAHPSVPYDFWAFLFLTFSPFRFPACTAWENHNKKY